VENRMNFISDVINLYVYDEKGKNVANLTTLTKGDFLFEEKEGEYKLYVNTPELNLSLLKFLGEFKEESKTDWEKMKTFSGNDTKTLEFGKQDIKHCKLFANTISYDSETNKVNLDLYYEIPKCTIKRNVNFLHTCDKVSGFDYVFTIIPYDEKGNSFKLHIKERN
jgi:hypothetical protein